MQLELAKTIIPNKPCGSFKATENFNTKLLRRDYLAKQAEIQTQWILECPLLGSKNAFENLKYRRNSAYKDS